MVKTLTITDAVYNELVSVKGKTESFSKLFLRLVKEEKTGLSDFAGFLSEKEAFNMKNAIKNYREKSAANDLKREKRIEKLWQ